MKSYSNEAMLAGFIASAPAATVVPAIVKGAASQSVDLQQWQSSVGTSLARVNSVGEFSTGTTIGTPALVRDVAVAGVYMALTNVNIAVINRTTAGNVPFLVRGMAAQTGDLQLWQDSTPTTVAKVSASGVVSSAGLAVTNAVVGNVPVTIKGAVGQTADLERWTDSSNNVIARIKATTAQTGTPAAATDLATALTLLNDLRTKLLNLGLIS